MKFNNGLIFLILVYLLYLPILNAQVITDTTAKTFTLEECIQYALQKQPSIRRALIDEEIGEKQIRANLAGWLPQISSQYNYAHNFRLQTAAFGENLIQIGRKNTSNILFQANQVLYSNDVWLAFKGAKYVRMQADQNTAATKINTVVDVSKAFYDILLTQQQIRILEENIGRQEKQYHDAFHRYRFGVVDKTDYQRASITLSNSKSERKRAQEDLKAKNAFLKQLLGYPSDSVIRISFDISQMEERLLADTNQTVNFSSRIEFQQLQTRKQLLGLNTAYYQWGFLPTVSAFINYNFLYLNNDFSQLYRRSFPTSAGGLSAALPIFQGTRRLQYVKISKLQEKRGDIDIENIRYVINTEYQSALADYKGNLNEFMTLRANVAVAREVYNIIKLQYDEGVKAYVDLIVAEIEVKTTEINYINALYRLLASKLDLERALGKINVNQ